MLTLFLNVGFYLFDCKVFGDTEEANKVKGPRFLLVSLVLHFSDLILTIYKNKTNMNPKTKERLFSLIFIVLGSIFLIVYFGIKIDDFIKSRSNKEQTTNVQNEEQITNVQTTSVNNAYREVYKNGYSHGRKGRNLQAGSAREYCREMSILDATIPQNPSDPWIEGFNDAYNYQEAKY